MARTAPVRSRPKSAPPPPPQGPWFFLFWFWDDELENRLRSVTPVTLGQRPQDLGAWTYQRQGDTYAYHDATGRLRFRLPVALVDEAYRGLSSSGSYSDGVLQQLGGGYRPAIDEILAVPLWKDAERRGLSQFYFELAPRAVADASFRAALEALRCDYETLHRNLLDVGEPVAEAMFLSRLAMDVRDARRRDTRRKRYASHVAALLRADSPMTPRTRELIAADWKAFEDEDAQWERWFEERMAATERRIGVRPFTKTDCGKYKGSRPLFNPLIVLVMAYLLAGRDASGKHPSQRLAATFTARTLGLFAREWLERGAHRRVATRYRHHRQVRPS